MVSISNVVKIGGLGVGLLAAYVLFKNAGAIGSNVGGFLGNSFNAGFKSITDSFNSAFGGFTHTSPEQIINTGGFTNAVDPPSNAQETFASKREKEITRESIALSGLFEGSNTVINVKDRLLEGSHVEGSHTQDLTQIFNKEGKIRVGTEGLHPSVIKAQAELSAKYNTVTFDVDGRLSTVNGLVSAR